MKPNSEINPPPVKFTGKISGELKAILRGIPVQPVLFHGQTGRLILLHKKVFRDLPPEYYEKLRPYIAEVCCLPGEFRVLARELPSEVVTDKISLEVFITIPGYVAALLGV